MNWKATVKKSVPASVLNNTLLTFPFLYGTKIVNFETNLPSHGVEDLLSQLKLVLHLEGDIIECGSSRCGATSLMAKLLKSKNVNKVIYACDSFEGFDRDELRKEQQEGLTNVTEEAFTSTSYDYVKAKLNKLNLSDTVNPIKGYFQNTLPTINNNFCFAFIDCDFRDSLVYCAETLWSHLGSQGRIVFDDYIDDGYKGARLGVDYFVDKYKDEIEEHGLLNHLYMVKKA
jgi:Macrocin-O-methyltransferase (TylF)